MSENQPRCHCGGETKHSSTISRGTTKWRCKRCGASSVRRHSDTTNSTVSTAFTDHPATGAGLDTIASRAGCSPRTLQCHFEPFQLVDVSNPTIGHIERVYDQVFLDGTCTVGGCLIIAATIDHTIAWRWYKCETTHDY